MFACEHHGVVPDIMPLAKALGGGMVPIGAVVFGQDSLSEDFGLRHTSTFGGNAFCSRVGVGAVDLLTADDQALVRQVAQRGDYLLAGLREVASRHPELVADVRGQGLLLGVQLSDDPDLHAQQGLFRSLADQEGLAGFLCGYLLRNEGIRLAPAYFANSVLRVEPPLNVSEADCDTLLGALDRGLDVIERGDSARFFAHLLPASERPTAGTSREEDGQELGGSHPERLRPRDGEPRWAFIAHPTDLASYESYDSRLGLPGEQVRVLFDRMNQCRNVDTAAAMLVGRCRVETDTGESDQENARVRAGESVGGLCGGHLLDVVYPGEFLLHVERIDMKGPGPLPLAEIGTAIVRGSEIETGTVTEYAIGVVTLSGVTKGEFTCPMLIAWD